MGIFCTQRHIKCSRLDVSGFCKRAANKNLPAEAIWPPIGGNIKMAPDVKTLLIPFQCYDISYNELVPVSTNSHKMVRV